MSTYSENTAAGAAADPAPGGGDAKGSRRMLASTFLGTTIEWYDFLVYGFLAPVALDVLFFPQFSPLVGTIAAFSVFAVGFLARPLGGIVFGHLGDRVGRKPIMIWTMALAGAATTAMGLLPTYATIGLLAPVVLVVLRFVQGLALGGESAAGPLLATESAPGGRRGLFAAIVQSGAAGGTVLGATAAGELTAMTIDVLSDTGAYGNHAIGVLFHGCHESVALYRCANKRVDAEAVYTHTVPAGAFRGYGLGQVIFAIESALDDLAREVGLSAAEIRRRNAVVPGDELVVNGPAVDDIVHATDGLPQCLDLVEQALAATEDGPPGPGWLVGEGLAAAMIATIPPRGHHSTATVTLAEDGSVEVGVGSAEFGNGSATVHVQLVATALGGRLDPSRIRVRGGDTDAAAYDTGAYGSTGSVVAGGAVHAAAQDLARRLDAGEAERPLVGTGEHHGTPRSVAFNVHGVRVAVHPPTGEVRVLRSVHAADAGVVLNPEQLRGQVEGGVAQGFGSALQEEVRLEDGVVTTRSFRDYRVPQIGQVPHTEVLFADTVDPVGPHGAKSMSEAPYTPVAPAVANAVRDATGRRPRELPMSRDRVWRLLTSEEDPCPTP